MTPRKLVIWDSGWAPHASEFKRQLGTAWSVTAEEGNLKWFLEEVRDAQAVVALSMPKEARSRAASLEAFLFPGAGILQTDPESLPKGCRVVNVYEHETPIAEYVLMMMLAHVTRLSQHLESFKEGRWDGSGRIGGAPHGELAGRTVGLLGYGHIGRAVADRARAFGMSVIALDREPEGQERLAGMLRQSDFLVIAAPLTEETRALIGQKQIELLPPHAFLVNVSRAEIVEEEPLYRALESGRLAGAALDVWYEYPNPGEPGYGSRFPFHRLPGVYCTPHYSAWSEGMIHRRIARMCETLQQLERGEELDRVVMVGTWRP
ncbi:MAG: hypothetical protein HY821_09545 [Acidobacteria bacterium]|nr:hypothetical protein [Acidobacteriota bacterium]